MALEGYEPMNSWILVRREESPEETRGGLVIPEVAKRKQVVVEVLKMGAGCDGLGLDFGVGDEVIIGDFDGTEVVIGGEPYTMIQPGNVMAALEPESC